MLCYSNMIIMKEYDKKQQTVIDFIGGHALVLAAPGCGKTEILSQRILKAHNSYGVSYEDMLCVTFTNRASRDMKERVKEVLGDNMSSLFVGNLHRLCIHFLYDNQIIPIDTGIIDDTDQNEIIAELFGHEPRQWEINKILDYSCKQFEYENNFPKELRLHERAQYSSYGELYVEYKRENQVIDFDDILLLTYKEMMNPDFTSKNYLFTGYKWIQVDEVQDLNPLQLSIIEKLSSGNSATIIYLGDERQAIYGFLGANHGSIENIERKCGDNVFNLSNNYRSPMYLLDMLNDYARNILKIDNDKLPTTTNKTYLDDALQLVKCVSNEQQYHVLAMLARNIFFNDDDKDSIGILVRTNADADAISEILDVHKIKHLKITNKDMFKMVNFKTLYAHFSVVSNDTRYSDWSRLLYQTRVISKISDARKYVREMREICISPTDLMNYENSSYTIEFTRTFQNKEIVVFDTETTGLDVFNDDIIQIAAIKVRDGKVVPGSELDIIIETNKTIPPMLKKGFVNPMVAEYNNRSNGIKRRHYERFMKAEDAFRLFVEYVGDDELLGHNVNYDIHILENNIKRRTSNVVFSIPIYWDTLKLSRMLDPNLRKHTLEGLLEVYGLEGVNSHNAMDDILATKSLAEYCFNKLLALIVTQKDFLVRPEMKDIQRRLLRNYYPLYQHTFEKLYSDVQDEEHTFDFEFNYIYNCMVEKNYIESIKRFDYMRALFKKVVIESDKDLYFNNQLMNHIYEFRTFNEADLYQNGIITERVHIMTIHKSKGLEFDNVFIHNATEGVIPHYRSTNPIEDAKVLYVGMSRAKKRVWLTYNQNASRFLRVPEVQHHFDEMIEGQRDKLLEMEMKMFVKKDN